MNAPTDEELRKTAEHRRAEQPRPRDPAQPANLVGAIMGLAERSRLKQEQRLAKWGDAIDAAPNEMCPRHPGSMMQKDVGRSAWESGAAEKLIVVHHPCPHCEAASAKQTIERRLLRRGLPPRSLHVTLATWEPAWEPTAAAARAEALRVVTDWTERRQCPFLIVIGSNGGTGKTALGVAALREFGKDIRCLEFRDWICQTMALPFADRQPMLEAVRVYDGLMIDDFGNRHIARDELGGNAFERDAMATVLNWRFERRLPTIITSNLDAKEFVNRLDDRTVDRIMENRVLIDATGWPSRRAAKL